jgi:hypothetical protein
MLGRKADQIAVIDAQLSLLEDEIARAHVRARELRTRRNALNGLCSLPSDLIQQILDILVEDYRNPPPFRYLTPNFSFFRFVGTCTRIRALAVATPTLWSHIDFKLNKEWIHLGLERARSSLLTVDFNEGWGILKDLQLLLSLMPKARNLTIFPMHGKDNHRVDPIHKMLDQSLPHLESLRYSGPPNIESIFNLSQNFGAGTPSRLTTLKVSHVFISGETVDFPCLTHIDISHVTANRPEDIWRLLYQMPKVESLSLSDIPSFDITHDLVMGKIPWKHLNIVDISAPLIWISLFLDTLPFPLQNCSLCVITPDDDHEEIGPSVDQRRLQSFEAALELYSLSPAPSMIELCYESNTYWVLKLGRYADLFIYEDAVLELSRFDGILPLVEELRVDVHVEGAFRYAARSLIDPFSAVEWLTIDCRFAGFDQLRDWLRRRAAEGNRLHSIDFDGGYNTDDEITPRKSTAEIAYELMQEKLVDVVLESGGVPGFISLD